MKKGFVFLETIIVLTVVTLSLTILLTSYTLITTKAKEKENYNKVSDKYLLYTFSNLGTNATYNYKEIANKGYLKLEPGQCTNDQVNEYDSARIFRLKDNHNNDNFYTIDDAITCFNGNSITTNPSCDFFHIFDPKIQNSIMVDTTHSTGLEDGAACEVVLNKLGIKYLYIIPNVQEVLDSEYATTIFDVGTLNYIKTLKKCHDSDIYTTVDENGNVIVNNKEDVDSRNCENPVNYMVGVFYRNNEHYFAAIEL